MGIAVRDQVLAGATERDADARPSHVRDDQRPTASRIRELLAVLMMLVVVAGIGALVVNAR